MTRTIDDPRNGQNFNVRTVLHVTECPTCGITYAFPDRLDERARERNSAIHGSRSMSVYCPLGHAWHYTGKNEEQRLRDRLAAEQARRDQAEASARAQKGAASRARRERDQSKTRHAAGVCPCCNRSFKQLRRHMQTKHPDYEPVEV